MSQKAAAPQKHSERIWRIPCGVMTDDGLWVPDQRAAVDAEVEVATILLRVGGVVSQGVERADLKVLPHDGQAPRVETVTTSILIRWQSFSPAHQKAAEEPEAAVPETS